MITYLIFLLVGTFGNPEDSTVIYDLFLSADTTVISRSQGGEINFMLYAPTSIGYDYQLMGSVTGTIPGTPLPNGVILPINRDWMTYNLLYFNAIGTICYDFNGKIPKSGSAIASIRTGPLTCCEINEMFFAFCVHDGKRWGASNFIRIGITY